MVEWTFEYQGSSFMQLSFWQQRWQNNQIGFHEGVTNVYLLQYWSQLHLTENAAVFVPLSGKSQDLLWLAAQAYRVFAVECSELAVQAFFDENDLNPTRSTVDGMDCWQHETITIYCGDFFSLQVSHLPEIKAVFDRAAIIALTQEHRQDYVKKLQELCPSAQTLLVTLDYDQQQMDGPPYALPDDEVHTLYAHRNHLKCLMDQDVLSEHGKFSDRGLDRLHEKVYLLKPVC